tara:strand:- start:198 stop:569 length:372 start_codon:yes stop_codon:yes gene_type:complete
MGNRAVLEFKDNSVGIYLHWNGGRNTVEPLLDVAREYGVRGDNYGIARLAQMIGNFFGGTLSIGVGLVDSMDCDNGDNGVYLIDNKLNIIERKYFSGQEQTKDNPKLIKQQIKNSNDNIFKGE